jgi:mannose-6-phosphate isomerase-like protein (cupin superfamily)
LTDEPSFVRRADEAEEYFFEEGCWILELSNHEHDPELSVARARVPPRGQTEPHYLTGVTERYLILEGSAEVTVGTDTVTVGAGDVVQIPAGATQSIRNLTDADLVFLALCTPRFERECYVAVRDTGAR